MIYSVISGTGCYIPTERVKNEDFLGNEFYGSDGKKLSKSNDVIIDQFLDISTIAERRHVTDDLVASDIAFFAAKDALESSNTDKESLDYIIVAHNFGDIKKNNRRTDIVPSLAARVKFKLGINNPNTVAYDTSFGCPGWLQAVIQANYYIKSGDAKRVMVIGAETLSRISDPHDRDSMLYADGAGATILQAVESDSPVGILAHKTRSDTLNYSQMLFMDKSNYIGSEYDNELYLKMNGRKLYQYALENVPQTVKECLDRSHVSVDEVKKILIHQANGKMDDAIVKRLFNLYGIESYSSDIMPMTISWLGNSSVATIPTLLDLIRKGKLKDHTINKGDVLVLASVGAGMNINSLVYRC